MEAVKVIISAWSVAFIIMFVVVMAGPNPHPESVGITLAGAVTGAGWLWYRSSCKPSEGETK